MSVKKIDMSKRGSLFFFLTENIIDKT